MVTAGSFSYSFCFIPAITKQKNLFVRYCQRLLVVMAICLVCLFGFSEMWCLVKMDDPRRSYAPVDFIVDMTFYTPEANRIPSGANDFEVTQKLFCPTTGKFYVTISLIPPDDPMAFGVLETTFGSNTLTLPCDPKAFLSYTYVNEDRIPKIERMEIPFNVISHGAHSVTIQMNVYGADLVYKLHAPPKRFPMADFGKAIPIYTNYGSKPFTWGVEDFSFPPDIPESQIAKEIEFISDSAFNTIELEVRPNPRIGSLNSSWTVHSPRGAGGFGSFNPNTLAFTVSARNSFFRVDDDCWSGSIFTGP